MRLREKFLIRTTGDQDDEENVDVGSAEVLWNESLVAGEDLGHQAAENDQEDVLIPKRVQEPYQRGLGAGAGLAGALLIHERRPFRPTRRHTATRSR
jgi:hypothetical protein